MVRFLARWLMKKSFNFNAERVRFCRDPAAQTLAVSGVRFRGETVGAACGCNASAHVVLLPLGAAWLVLSLSKEGKSQPCMRLKRSFFNSCLRPSAKRRRLI